MRKLKLTKKAPGEYTCGAYTIRRGKDRPGWIVCMTDERSRVIVIGDTLDDACNKLHDHVRPAGAP